MATRFFINDIQVNTLVYDIKFISGKLEGIETRCRISYPVSEYQEIDDETYADIRKGKIFTDLTGNKFVITYHYWE